MRIPFLSGRLPHCRGETRAERRRKKNELWQKANDVSLRFRMAIAEALDKAREELLAKRAESRRA